MCNISESEFVCLFAWLVLYGAVLTAREGKVDGSKTVTFIAEYTMR